MTAPDYQVVIVRYGTRATKRSDVYLNYQLYGEPDEPIQMDYFFWVLRNAERTIVVDTGFSADGGARRGRTTLVPPAEAFGHLGIEPASAVQVVATHAHYDHIGNLGLFTAADVYICERELGFWSSRHARRTMFHHSVDDADLAGLTDAQRAGRVRAFGDQVTVAPGVDVIRIGGHTPGQSVVKVRTSDGVVLLASDAVHYDEELARDMLFMSVSDLVEMYEGFERVRAMRDSGEVQHIVPGHDPGTLARFSPVRGSLAGLAASIGELRA
jgi:glyoxylase-like metal-dependent hydrolase (beta-lactamase superfamily II)